MNNVDRDFCKQCDNKLQLKCDKLAGEEHPVLVSICETCNETKSYTLSQITDNLISYTPYMVNYAMTQYGNIKDDNTIPYATNQKCAKCQNTKVKQICTNQNDMKYIFICEECESQWSII